MPNDAGDPASLTRKLGRSAGEKPVNLLMKSLQVRQNMLDKLVPQALLVAVVFWAGYHYGSRGEREVKVINEVVEKVVLETIYEDRIKYVDRVKTVEKLVPQIVEREVYKNICMDEDGLKVFNTYIGVR